MANMPYRVVRKALLVFSMPFTMLLYLLVRVLLRRRSIRITLMDPRYLGHLSLEPEVFWNDLRCAVEHGSRDIWLCSLGKRSEAINPSLWDLRSQQLPTVPSYLVSALVELQKLVRTSAISLERASIHRLNALAHRPTSLPTTEPMRDRRKEILSRLPIPNRPYAIFTVREVTASPDLRNREIREFVPAMAALIDRGYNVIRLTSRTEDLIQQPQLGVLDWQVLVDGQPGDELALVSGASFVVSTTTGIDCLALAYRIPVLYIDTARLYFVFLGTEFATFQMPRLIDNETGMVLSFTEILKRGLGLARHSDSFTAGNTRVLNSTPFEIEQYVLEYVNLGLASHRIHSDESQNLWRESLLEFHRAEIAARHGAIEAQMLPSCLPLLSTKGG